ncbi:MAG: DUF502 domain-containing protein [Phycisphaerales bacterium]|nr:DUF502 domain-containing protein [Phycisphaerales bacterium]
MTPAHDRRSSSHFKRFFVRGLVILLPSVLTLWLLVTAYRFIDSSIAQPINSGVRMGIVNTPTVWPSVTESWAFEPNQQQMSDGRKEKGLDSTDKSQDPLIRKEYREKAVNAWWKSHWYLNFIGIVIAILAVYFAGRLLGGFFGRRLYRQLEKLIESVPIIKLVYPYIKQVVDFLFGEDQPIKFNRVVAVEYPRKGIWAVGFLTGNTLHTISAHSGEAVTVFIPSSPTPFTGYTITVPANEIIEMPLTVEEAIRFTVSGGVLIPGREVSSTPVNQDGDAAPPPQAEELAKMATDSSNSLPIPDSNPDAKPKAPSSSVGPQVSPKSQTGDLFES